MAGLCKAFEKQIGAFNFWLLNQFGEFLLNFFELGVDDKNLLKF